MDNKTKLLISFSGGRTSAYMTYKIIENYKNNFEIKVVFANTGQEHENTLRFVQQCDEYFGFETTWVETVVHEGRKGSTHKIVDFLSASRDGKPYEDVIKKYGIPNQSYPHCTRELKLAPIHHYVKSIGWNSKEYITAIGIRSDETRRVSKNAAVNNFVYPLVDWMPTTKTEINEWWSKQPFNLDIQEHQGNCVWCWKKSYSKLIRVARENPEFFDFPARMEQNYGHCGKNNTDVKRVFFREYTSAEKLLELSKKIIPDNFQFKNIDPNLDSGCSESCEMYPMEEVQD